MDELATIEAESLATASPRDLAATLCVLSDEEIDGRFEIARNQREEDCKERGAPKNFSPLFSEPTIARLKKRDKDYPSKRIDRIYKERLIYHYLLADQKSLYQQIAGMIGQEESDRDLILRRYYGEYRYFRYAARATDDPKYADGKPVYVMGMIKVANQRGEPVFGHWSHDVDFERPKPEHVGYVFRIDKSLFFAARGPGLLRLSITRRAAHDQPIVMPGLTLSMRSHPTDDPFAARFLLIRCEHNQDVIDRLDPDTPGAERRFRSMMKARKHDHYMLLD